MRRLTGLVRYVRPIVAGAVLVASGLAGQSLSSAETGLPNVSVTAHNLSKTGTGEIKATTETQICVFCHTPHGANTTTVGPLWNRSTPPQSYTRYTSSSLDASYITTPKGFSDQPGGSSVLCLSCHDGTVAIGNVNNAPGSGGSAGTIATSGGDGYMPGGQGANTGYTRRLGTDLTNDHPISITYSKALADRDGQLVQVAPSTQKDVDTGGAIIAPRSHTGTPPLLPLERTGPMGAGFQKAAQIQCGTCHDPHLDKSKFLRLNRLQANNSPTGSFSQANDIICLGCHKKAGWAQSVHADANIADEAFTVAAATLRGFPTGTKVWQASCLSCHDTHTVQGSRRLLREGVTGADGAFQLGAPPGGALDTTSAVENTCYQCHRPNDAYKVIGSGNGAVPDIKTEFERPYTMPIRTSEQADGTHERHDITTGDGIESQANLGRNDTTARHAECPDCHNPHTIRRNSKFYGVNGDANSGKRTHDAGTPTVNLSAAEAPFINVASGALRGAWGVEPVYTSSRQLRAWPVVPDGFDVKKGDPGGSTSVATSSPYLTREYQLCFKCHSNYANGDSAILYPTLGGAKGTPFGTNGMQRYTNVAAEFAGVNAGVDANGLPLTGTDQGEAANPTMEYSQGIGANPYATTNQGTACGGGDCAPVGSVAYTGESMTKTIVNRYNHRSWHPVMYPTGRDAVERTISATRLDTGASRITNMRPPWYANMGRQTMQCSDCHGQKVTYDVDPWFGTTTLVPAATQGPHGSDNKFLLKRQWDLSVEISGNFQDLCRICHAPGGDQGTSGFVWDHWVHPKMGGSCMTCHIAVPHGWKNKAFLVNLRCVGSEIVGYADGCTAVGGDGTWPAATLAPYYNGARLRISRWMRSGTWFGGTGDEAGCGNMNACY